MKKIVFALFLFAYIAGYPQNSGSYNFSAEFNAAYAQNNNIPRGILEAVAYNNTRLWHVSEAEPASCTGMPRAYGVMGLILDGKNWFRENLKLVSELSGFSVEDIISNPQINIEAYARAFSVLKQNKGITSAFIEDHVSILHELSEIKVLNNDDAGSDYALNSQIYQYLSFLNNNENSIKFNFPSYNIDLLKVFGSNNLRILSSPKIQISERGVVNENGEVYIPKNVEVACPDYPLSHCFWVQSNNHYSGRNGHTLSSVAMHTVQGSYSGCISWFQNSQSSASTQYVVRSADGQLTQMVRESDGAWHVGSENWYTVGYEHEGYVDNPAWYTTAMYQSSAALTRDICAQWNINTLRTFFRDTLDSGTAMDYGIHSLGGEGTCIKIKGHQHYPNQTHTDPGPNWNWNYYFKLLNPSPTPVSYTTATGTFYDSGGSGADYADDERKLWLIAPANASSVTINFSSFAVEANYDFMYIYNGDNVFAPCLGRWNTQSPGTVTASSGKMLIEFRSDCATTGAGWSATWTSVLTDATAPTTLVTSSGTWKTGNFTATFTDQDNAGGSGIEKSYYQVLDNSGTDWRANAGNGFFSDNFDLALNPEWQIFNGTWTTVNGSLRQNDSTIGNTNIYAQLNQNLSNRYLYHFTAKIESAPHSTNQRRFGLHFHCDTGNVSQRGNSYFIFFRQETSKLEFYRVQNSNPVQSKVVDNVVTNIGQWYDIKVIYDRITGLISVYRDNVFVSSWTDPSPLTNSGNYISFRTGNCKASFGELKVYRSRAATANITVGSASTNDIRYQNPNPSTYGAKIKSIVNDASNNISQIYYHDLNIDWTPPLDIASINDGSTLDSDTTFLVSELSGNWTATTDANSGVVKYWYCIGTTPGGSDVKNWTDNGSQVSFTLNSLSLSYNQQYYISVKAENAAGLQSGIKTSDGILVKQAVAAPVAGFTVSTASICNGSTVDFANTSVNATSYQWNVSGPASFSYSSSATNLLLPATTSGQYVITLNATGPGGSNQAQQQLNVTVHPLPVANAGNDVSVCNGSSIALNATGGLIYQWSDGVQNNVSFVPQQSKTYYVTVTSEYSCSATDSVNVTVNSLPLANAGQSQTVCAGNSVTLNATGGSVYTWDNGVLNNVPFVPVQTAIYNVTVTDNNGCSDISSLIVTVKPNPQASFSALDTTLMLPNNASAVFMNNSVNADSYLWDFGDGSTSYDIAPWHSYTDTGYFSVILYAISGTCGTDTLVMSNYIYVDYQTGISNISYNEKISVSPNPFKNEFYISIAEKIDGDIKVSVTDILGREVFKGKYSGNDTILKINAKENLSNGLYNVKLVYNGKTEVVQLLKD